MGPSSEDLIKHFTELQIFKEKFPSCFPPEILDATLVSAWECFHLWKEHLEKEEAGQNAESARSTVYEHYSKIINLLPQNAVVWAADSGLEFVLNDLLQQYPTEANNALIKALKTGNANLDQQILICLKHNATLTSKDRQGRRPIDIAVEMGYKRATKLLKTAGSPPGVFEEPEEISPLKEKPSIRLQRASSQLIDWSNRFLFEACVDFLIHPIVTLGIYCDSTRDYKSKAESYYQQNRNKRSKFLVVIPYLIPTIVYAVIWFVVGLAVRLFLLPVTATVYNLSRLQKIILKWNAQEHNYYKAQLMRITTLAIISSLLIAATAAPFNQAFLHLVSTSFRLTSGIGPMGAAATGTLILVTVITIGLACFLYAAKTLAQAINKEFLYQDCESATNGVIASKSNDHCYATAPKHHYRALTNTIYQTRHVKEKSYEDAYRNALYSYHSHYKGKLAISGESPSRAHFKNVIEQFERVSVASNAETLTLSTYVNLYHQANQNHTPRCWKELVIERLKKEGVKDGMIVPRGQM